MKDTLNKNLEIFERVTAELKELLPKGSLFCIAGGAVRDAIIGKQIKDIDVVYIHPTKGTEGGILHTLSAIFPEHYTPSILGGLSEETPIEEIIDYEGSNDFNERLLGVIEIDMNGLDVDILVQRNSQSLEEAIKGFDHTINLVYYEGGKIKTYLDRPIYDKDYAKDEIFKELYYHDFIRSPIPECRVEKITLLVEEYGEKFNNNLAEYLHGSDL